MPEVNLERVISGGQTGSDVSALYTAKLVGIKTGGWLPKGCITLDGPCPALLTEYNMKEHAKAGYPARTEQNVIDSDGTLRFASNWSSTGEKCTLKNIKWHSKPYIDVTIGKPCDPFWFEVYQWLALNNIKVLNVAGNSEKTSPGIGKIVTEYLTELFTYCMNKEALKMVLRDRGYAVEGETMNTTNSTSVANRQHNILFHYGGSYEALASRFDHFSTRMA